MKAATINLFRKSLNMTNTPQFVEGQFKFF